MRVEGLNRREFLQATAAAALSNVTSNAIAPSLWAQAAGRQPSRAPDWASRVNRWAQLTLTEDDPANPDLVGFWLDYFKRTRSDGVCISGGGCVAYYPTAVPYHHRSAWLGNRDTLGDFVTGCRKQGMSVLIRTDPHATYDDAKAAHPEWIAVTADAQPRRHWAAPDMWVTCALGPYNFDFMTAVHNEIMQKYRPDGIFMNRWDGSGDCYCESCRTNFRKATGLEIPRTQDARDPSRRAFLEWRRKRLLEVLDVWNSGIRAINAVSSIVPNNGSGALSPLDAVETSSRAPMLVADRQARHGLAAPWLVGKSAKEYRATMGDKPVVGLFGLGLEEPYRWKDSVTSNAEIRIWAVEAIANGMRPWFSKFSGTLRDERWLKGVEDLYLWTAENDTYLQNRQPIAEIAIVYSQQTDWYAPEAKAEDAALGWYQALVESRIPFEMVHDRLLEQAASEYKTLILPNISALSDAQCAQLKSFVARGGNIVATNQTSLRDEFGTEHKNFGLAELFGVDWTGKIDARMQNSYIRLEHEAAKGSPLFAGLEDAPRIINGVSRVDVRPREAFPQTPFTLIPSYPDLPMEKVYPRVAKTDISCLYLREAGRGRVAYFPFDIDRTFWEVLNEDHLKMMRNALLWAHNRPAVVEVEGPGLLDVTVWRNPHSFTIHLVNLTNPMALKGPYRDFFPVGPHTVKLRLPDGANIKRARLLASGTDAELRRNGAIVSITVPTIRDHEMLAFDI